MRVLHVIPSVAPRYGGPSQAVLGMCRQLSRQSVATVVAATNADESGTLPVRLGEVVEFSGQQVVFFPRQFSKSFLYSRPMGQWLSRHVRDFDVVHIHAIFSYSSLAAAKACRRDRVPYIVRPFGSLDPWSLNRRALQKKLLWRFGVAEMLREASAIHYTTNEEMRLAETPLGLTKGVVIPLGIDRDPTDSVTAVPVAQNGADDTQHRDYVLALSRLHPKKGLEILIDGFASAVESGSFESWRLIIAGDGEPAYESTLIGRAQATKARSRIIFSGWLAGNEKAEALHGAGLFALTSYQENFGLAVAEAMSYGVPVLVSKQVNLSEDIEASGAGWVTDLTVSATAHALVQAMADRDERRRRGDAGRTLANTRFTWSAVGSDLLRLYERLIRGKFAG